jgi:hypothetical protein
MTVGPQDVNMEASIAGVRADVIYEIGRQRIMARTIYLPQLVLMSVVSIVISCAAI